MVAPAGAPLKRRFTRTRRASCSPATDKASTTLVQTAQFTQPVNGATKNCNIVGMLRLGHMSVVGHSRHAPIVGFQGAAATTRDTTDTAGELQMHLVSCDQGMHINAWSANVSFYGGAADSDRWHRIDFPGSAVLWRAELCERIVEIGRAGAIEPVPEATVGRSGVWERGLMPAGCQSKRGELDARPSV